MAQGRQQVSDLAQVNQRVASFGILPEEAVSEPLESEQRDQDIDTGLDAGSDERRGADAPLDDLESGLSADALDTDGDGTALEGDDPDKAKQDSRIADYEARL